MNLLEVAKHALEAMEDAMYRADTHEFYDAKESLRYAIEQAEQAEQKPVASGHIQKPYTVDEIRSRIASHDYSAELLLQHAMLHLEAPAPRKPLKEDEIADLWDGHTVPVFGKIGINPIVFARAIERAHGIGEQHE